MSRGGRIRLRHLLNCVAVAALAGCGGGGSSGESAAPPVAAPSPTPSPAPAPTPSPTPAPAPPSQLYFISLGVAAQDASGGGRLISDAVDSAVFQLKASDPDAPAASRYEDLNFDGDETFIVTNVGTVGLYNENLLDSDFAGTTSVEYQGDMRRARLSPRSVWQSRRGSGNPVFLIFQDLEEVRKTPAAAPVTGNRPEHVRVVEVRLADRRGVQAFGSRSPAGAIPMTGTAVFVGEVFGNLLNSNGHRDEFVGDAVLNVDFARRTVTGQISVGHFLFSATTPPVRIEFSASISGEGFEAQRVTVTGSNIIQGGTLRGAFFGEAADEIGLVFSTSGASGNIIAGLVAGKE